MAYERLTDNSKCVEVEGKLDVAKQFKIVRELISKATTIVNTGDSDHGGQFLVELIRKVK